MTTPARPRLSDVIACLTDDCTFLLEGIDALGKDGYLHCTSTRIEVCRKREWKDPRDPVAWAKLATPSVDIAWEWLATRGAIPMEWLDDARRRFSCGSPDCGYKGHAQIPTPWSIADVIAFASDASGIAHVEALALECANAINSLATQIAWRVVKTHDAYTASTFDRTAPRIPKWMWDRLHERKLSDEIYKTGYGLRYVDDHVITLVCPSLETP